MDVDGGIALTRDIVDGEPAGQSTRRRILWGGHGFLGQGWVFHSQTPTLTCLGMAEAVAAVEFLRGKGVKAFVTGRDLVAPLQPTSVLRFAEDAIERGWADDEACARMIAAMSDEVDRARSTS